MWCLMAVAACLGQSSDKTLKTQPQVQILEFADFQCPFCAREAADLEKLRAEYSGSVVLTFKHFPLPIHKQSKPAHLAALAAGQQGKFWAMHDLIFAHPDHLSSEDFEGYANALGLDKDKFRRSLDDPAQSSVIEKDTAEGKALGVNATPTFVIDGHMLVGRQSYARLKQLVEAELKGEEWPGPGRLTVNVAGAPFEGPESAPVTIVEFSDFQCPFCERARAPLQQLLKANQDKVRLVFKNFPLDIHQDSRLAHLAALAAGEQGKFWEMHDLIFTHQRTIKWDDLLGFAAQLQLDLSKFQHDMESPDLKAKIDADKNEGERLGVTATPTFVVNGEMNTGFSAQWLQAKIDHRAPAELQAVDLPTDLPELNLSFGPDDAPIKLRWYVDLTSPLTAQSAVELQHFLADHAGKVRVEFKNFPLPNHSTAMLVHEFVLAAAAQGKFWPVESLLLADPRAKDREELTSLASQAQLDQDKLWADIDAHKYAPMISRDLAEAKRLGVSGTPTFLVGDKKLNGVNALAALR